MRCILRFFAYGLALSIPASAQQYCTGTCQQPPPVCSQGSLTTLTGVVYAPNGIDPIPNVTVYLAGDAVPAMTAGVSCPVPGVVPPGSPVAGAVTGTDGSFTIPNAPINPPGQPQALVIVSGKWRRIVAVDLSAGACINTALAADLTRFPRNQSEGDIPKFAIATGAVDPVECVLYKVMGNDATEFTNRSATPSLDGRINFFLAEGSRSTQSGSYIGAPGATPQATALMGDPGVLKDYDVVMLPCEGADNTALRLATDKTNGELGNLVDFTNKGGRVYASHYSFDWLNQAQTFSKVANWTSTSTNLADQIANVDTSFADGSTLAEWLTLPSVHASSTLGQMPLQTLRHDFNGVIPPTQSWLALSNGNVMQFTFNTPVGASTGQCGRVLYNEYHVETNISSSNNQQFPGVCGTSTSMTPQEKLLEYMLFNLTSNGGDPKLTPVSTDFGSEPIGFTTGTQTFVWTNNSIFASAVTLLAANGDFALVGGNACTAVAPGASCTIRVDFTPTALGARTGTLTVGGGGKTLTAALTGTGVPALSVSVTSLAFGNLDVGAAATQSFQITNVASGPVPVPPVSASGDFSAASANCGSVLQAGASCMVNVTFKPTATGPRSGTVSFNSSYTGAVVALSGNGIDFSLSMSPPSGTVIAGRSVVTTLLAMPIAGYASPVAVTCSTSAPGATCNLSSGSLVPASGASDTVTIRTTSQYTVVGYSGLGGGGLLVLLAGGSLWILRRKLRRGHPLFHTGLTILLLSAASLALTGCGGLAPAQNNNYTGAGNYTFTLTATDGIIFHSTTYTLKVTVQ